MITSLEPRARPLQRRHRLDITREGAFHVDQAAAVDAVSSDDRLLGIVEVIHMGAEHQRRPAAGAFQSADDVGPPLLHLLILHVHSQPREFAAEILRDLFFFSRDADDPGQIPGELDQPLAAYSFDNVVFHACSSGLAFRFLYHRRIIAASKVRPGAYLGRRKQ